MRAMHWLVVLGLLALLGSACGSTQNAVRSTTTPRASGSPFTTYPLGQPGSTVATAVRQSSQCKPVVPAPALAPAVSSSRNLVIAVLAGGSRYVVRDITDITHPSTLSTFEAPSPPKFAGASDVSYVDDDGNVVRLTYASSRKLIVARCVSLFDWSPDGT